MGTPLIPSGMIAGNLGRPYTPGKDEGRGIMIPWDQFQSLSFDGWDTYKVDGIEGDRATIVPIYNSAGHMTKQLWRAFTQVRDGIEYIIAFESYPGYSGDVSTPTESVV